jgi:energy-coupling factor transporter ATP-binding protein EcfA2
MSAQAALMPREGPSLRVSGLSYQIDDAKLLTDIDFSLEAGEVASICGPTGSGKTTLGLVLADLLPADIAERDLIWTSISVLGVFDRAKDVRRIRYAPSDDVHTVKSSRLSDLSFCRRRVGIGRGKRKRHWPSFEASRLGGCSRLRRRVGVVRYAAAVGACKNSPASSAYSHSGRDA